MEGRDRLDKLQKDIYSRDFPNISNLPKKHDSSDMFEVSRGWQHEAGAPVVAKKPHSVFKTIFMLAFIFFFIALCIAGYIVYRGLNVISANNVDIKFVGPVSIAAADELDFDVVVQNNNSSPISNAILYIDYATGTKEVSDMTQDLLHSQYTLGSIASGATADETIKAVLFGQQHDLKDMNITLKYSVPNSNASFEKQKTYEVEISSAPLSMNVSTPTAISSGVSFPLTVTVTSNSTKVLSNMLVSINYPFGYTFTSSTPTPTYDNDFWLIPTLAPGEKETITLNGSLQGQENDQRTFRVSVGAQDAKNQKMIATAYLSTQNSLAINKPPLEALLTLNNQPANQGIVISPGIISGQVNLTNTTAAQILNASVSVILGGTAFDPQTPQTSAGGIYRVASRTLTWDKNSVPQLAQLNPGDTVGLYFSFGTVPTSVLTALVNGSVSLQVNATGQQVDPSSSQTQNLSDSYTSVAKFQSAVNMLSRLTYSTGPFTNTGPVPPKADATTTYTVTWILTNSSNPIVNGMAQATLAPYVNFIGPVSPSGAPVAFNSQSNTVVWQVGSVAPAGSAPAAQVSFQVGVDPTINEVGNSAAVLTGINFKGTDSFTNTPISVNNTDLTTSLPSDPNYGANSGIVQQ